MAENFSHLGNRAHIETLRKTCLLNIYLFPLVLYNVMLQVSMESEVARKFIQKTYRCAS